MYRLMLGAAALALSPAAFAQSPTASAIAERCIEQGGPAEVCHCAAGEMDARLEPRELTFILAVSAGEPGDPQVFAAAIEQAGMTMEDVVALQQTMMAAQAEIAETCGFESAGVQ